MASAENTEIRNQWLSIYETSQIDGVNGIP